MRSTSPSSGVRSRVRVCRRAVGFFGVGGFDDGTAESSAADATLSKLAFGAGCGAAEVEVASLTPGFAALADLLLLLREMEAFEAVKCAAMPLLGAIVAR